MASKGQQEWDDPDPSPYLYISMEQKRKDQTKFYDGKKMCWLTDEKDGFVQGMIKETKGDMCIVEIEGQEVSQPDFNKYLKASYQSGALRCFNSTNYYKML